MAQRPSVRRLQQLFLALLLGALGAAAGAGMVTLIPRAWLGLESLPGPAGWAALPVLLLGAWLAIFLHELGHVLAGLSQGFRFVLLAAGALLVERERGRLRLRFNRLPGTWGGLAACVPLDGRDAGHRMAMLALGGPAMSLVVAAGGLGAAYLVEPTSTSAALVRVCFLMTGGTSAFVFLATALLPSTGNGYRSDGARALGLLRGDAASEAEAAMLVLLGLSVAQQRPRDWPVALVERSQDIAEPVTSRVYARLLAFQHSLDRGDEARALAGFDAMMLDYDALPALARPSFAAVAAYVEGRYRHDAEKAGRWAAESRRAGLVDPHAVRQAEAAAALAAGDVAAARQHARQGLAELPRARLGASVVDREQLQELLARAGGDSQAAAPT